MSEFTAIMIFAAAIITAIGFGIQSLGKWFELQTARINKELAKSKNVEAEKQIESQSQTRTGSSSTTDAGSWIKRYFWRTQKSTVAFMLFLFVAPVVLGELAYKNTAPPVFIWLVSFTSPLCFLLGYLSLNQASEAYLAYRMAERDRARYTGTPMPEK